VNVKFSKLIPFLAILISTSANAALFDRGNGLIYDDALDITWLQDVNYALTSGYVSDGKMIKAEAQTWVNNLSFGDTSEWRLPSAGQAASGFNQTNSELGSMFYDSLGNVSNSGQFLSTFQDNNLNVQQSFLNAETGLYWLDEDFNLAATRSWVMWSSGYTGSQVVDAEGYAWAVHDGDIAKNADLTNVPIPASAFLFSSALFGLMVTRRQASP
jgi:hypothetical protein